MKRRAKVGNMSDGSQIRAAQSQARLEEQQHLADFRDVYASPAGERLFVWLFELADIGATEFSRDPYEQSFKAGQRNIGLKILGALTLADPTAFAAMMARAALKET